MDDGSAACRTTKGLSMKLGKKRGIVHDERSLKFATFVDPAIKPPPAAGTGTTVTDWPMFRNDTVGCCGLTSQAHRIIAQERSAHQTEALPTDGDVIAAYSAVSGYNPKTGENDNGVYLLDVCNFMRKVGLGREKDGTRHTIAAFVKVDPANMKLASYMFGGLYIGAGLPILAQEQIDAGKSWDFKGSLAGDAAPYSWGGHAMFATGYDQHHVGLVTWGRRQKATWGWVAHYVDEAYAVLTEDYLRGTKTPRGFDVKLLEQYLGRL